jgi:hypothetical protein
MNRSKENKIIKILLLVLSILIIIYLFIPILCSCKFARKEVTGESLGRAIKEIDEEVRVSREKVEEFEKLEKEDFELISLQDILEIAALGYQYTMQEQTSEDSSTITADLIDGRKIMIIKFLNPGKVEFFYQHLQSSLYNQGYNFENRLKYSELCNSFLSEDETLKAYLLKKQNHLMLLIK